MHMLSYTRCLHSGITWPRLTDLAVLSRVALRTVAAVAVAFLQAASAMETGAGLTRVTLHCTKRWAEGIGRLNSSYLFFLKTKNYKCSLISENMSSSKSLSDRWPTLSKRDGAAEWADRPLICPCLPFFPQSDRLCLFDRVPPLSCCSFLSQHKYFQ